MQRRWLVVATVMTVLARALAAQAPVPRPAIRVDPVDGIVEAFRTHEVVMLPGGHGSKMYHDLLLAILRDPRIQGTLTDVVVEFGSSRYQDVIDRFIRGDEITDAALRRVWQDTTIPGVTNDGPYVEEFYRAVRALNATLPKEKRFRVLGGDPPIDWANVMSRAGHQEVDRTARHLCGGGDPPRSRRARPARARGVRPPAFPAEGSARELRHGRLAGPDDDQPAGEGRDQALRDLGRGRKGDRRPAAGDRLMAGAEPDTRFAARFSVRRTSPCSTAATRIAT